MAEILDAFERMSQNVRAQPSSGARKRGRGRGGTDKRKRRVFISHGHAPDWRQVQDFIEKELKIPTLELEQEPNRGRAVFQKLDEESARCRYAVVVMTGDDKIAGGQKRTRENVMYEIGYFHAKLGLANVCLLRERGVSMPSNIHGLIPIPFPHGKICASFYRLERELQATLRPRT